MGGTEARAAQVLRRGQRQGVEIKDGGKEDPCSPSGATGRVSRFRGGNRRKPGGGVTLS